jgi:cruciform cutting endonuclease 1
MLATKPWLETLTLDKLRRLATEIGAPCSGTKVARINGIRRAVSSTQIKDKSGTKPEGLSLLSIDMGIRNLAFSHITAPVRRTTNPLEYLQFEMPTVQAWRRIAVSQPLLSAGQQTSGAGNSSPFSKKSSLSGSDTVDEVSKESFEPNDYAVHAYNLVKYMLQTYQPNQIVIERQRFRSGGGSAVQEWTLRVGVFEGMLYSVLRTLMEERKMKLVVEPMLPTRVNRYWLEGRDALPSFEEKKLTGRKAKKAKVELVASLLKEAKSSIGIAQSLEPFVAEFVLSCNKAATGKRTAVDGTSKLDDLADSLLQ